MQLPLSSVDGRNGRVATRLSAGAAAALLAGAGPLAGAAEAQAAGPAFRSLRYDEDWGSVCDSRPAEARPWGKCLSPGDGLALSLGGDFRERIELTENPAFGLVQSSDRVAMHRVLAHASLRAGPSLRAFVELGFAESSGRPGRVPPTDVDRLDLAQGFVDVSLPVGRGMLTVRPGRQEISLGTARLVSVRAGPNVRLSFDGLRLFWRDGPLRVDGFYLQPVQVEEGTFDNPTSRTQALWGGQLATPVSGPLKLEAYWLGFRNDRAVFANARGREVRDSFGVRLFGSADGWDFNTEIVVQDGRIGQEAISAWTVATDTGFTANLPLKTRFGLKADIASGDRRAGDGTLGTFNALFPRFPYFSEAAVFAPANFYDLQPSLTVSPRTGVSLMAAFNMLWRHRIGDSVYLAPLVPVAGTRGTGGRRTGHQWIVGGSWQANERLGFETQYVRFVPADGLRRIGGASGNFLMLSASARF